MRLLIGAMTSTIGGKPRVLKVYVDVEAETGKVVCPALSVSRPYDVAAALIAEHEGSDNEPLWVSKIPLALESEVLSTTLRQVEANPQPYAWA
jgi:hypothetical protein